MRIMKIVRAPKVLVILPFAFQEGLDKYAGIIRFLQNTNRVWEIRLDRMSRSTDNRHNYRLDDFDGIIADDQTSDQDVHPLLQSTLPLITLDWRNRSLLECRRKTVCISANSATIGRMAAETFIAIGQYASFAFLPTEQPAGWAAERQAAFAKRLLKRGLKVTTLTTGPSLCSQLQKLPKPAAVFAASDIAAAALLDRARDLQIAIPMDLSVISVDNEQLICNNTTPPLASIQPDFEKAGYLAAKALQTIFDRGKPSRMQHYPIKGLIQRKSLGIPRGDGRLVERACNLINGTRLSQLHGISNIARQLGISRRTLDKCFRQINDKSVLEYIQQRRLREMQTLLKSSNLPIAEICAKCFPSGSTHPMRFFKRATGLTMQQYRAQFSK